MDYTFHYDSPLGGITLASDGTALIGLWFDGQKHFASTLAPEHEERPLPVLEEAVRWLDLYFSGREPNFTPLLVLRTTAFGRLAAEIMRSIPYGKTMTYRDMARLAAERRGLASLSARAVGGAVGRNPISLIVPCHRVVGAHGSLTGYAAGIERKVRLLQLEGADMSGLFVPNKTSAL